MKNITDEVEELIRLYLWDATEDYVQAVLYGYRNTDISSEKYSKMNRKYLPNKPNGKLPVEWILQQAELKKCFQCDTVFHISNFRKHGGRCDGLQHECKACHQENTTRTQAARESKRRAAKLNRTPKWVKNDEELVMSIFINNCPANKHVDHIIPLQGKLVSGLHVPENLQYLSISDNCSKSNKFNME